MPRFARIFEHDGNRLLTPECSAKTRKHAAVGAKEFAQRWGLRDTGESFEFIDGAEQRNRRVAVFPPGVDNVNPEATQMLCIAGPILDTASAEIWVGGQHATPQDFMKATEGTK